MEGKMPAADDEIVIDRMYADNNHIEAGGYRYQPKTIVEGDRTGRSFRLQLPVSNNNDTMFDSVKFGVGIVAEEGFAEFKKEELF